MSNEHTHNSGPGSGNPDQQDEDIRRLLAVAGPRPEPPDAVRERVHNTALAAWEALPEPQRIAPRWYAAAASVVLGLAAVLVWQGALQTPADQPVGRIAFSSGGYVVSKDGSEDDRLFAGTSLRTSSEARLMIELANSANLRLDHDTSVTLTGADKIQLHHGRLYLDDRDDLSGASGASAAIAAGPHDVVVVTPHGVITKIGTQFEVFADNEALIVAVRHGKVAVDIGSQRLEAAAVDGVGDVLELTRSLSVSRGSVSTIDDPRWQWLNTSRPDFVFDQASVLEYLEWAARETGRTLEFASLAARQQAAQDSFHDGSSSDGRALTAEADLNSVDSLLSTTRNLRRVEAAPHKILVGFR